MTNIYGTNTGLRTAHAARINRVIEFIDIHLSEDMNLEVLADVAAYSKFHFHRIFRAFTGETLTDYIMRLRLEKAAYRLCIDTERSVTGIALDCGFSNSAVFAKNFKARFGMTASEWRKQKRTLPKQNDWQDHRSNLRDRDELNVSILYGAGTQTWVFRGSDNERRVTLENMPELTLAYLRYTGPYKGDATLFEGLFTRLFAWLGPHGLVFPDTSKTIVLYHEYPDITADEQLRISVCCTVPPDTTGEGAIGVMPFAPGLCAVSRFVCAADEYQRAWDWMYETWLPESGFLPADIPAFERYDFCAYDKNTGKTTVDICVPVLAK